MEKEIFGKTFISLIYIIFGFIFGVTLSVFAWVNPSQNPPLGGGVLQTDTSGLKIVTTTQVTSGNFTVNNGNVGIGTTAPGARLHVSGGSVGGGTSGIDITNTATGGRTYKLSAGIKGVTEGGFTIMDRTAGDVHRLVIDNNGNVGIGTTNPITKLDIDGRYKIHTFSHVVNVYNTAQNISLGSFYIGAPLWIDVNDSGCNGGGSISYYISAGYDPGVSGIPRVYTFGDAKSYPYLINKFSFYFKKKDSNTAYLYLQVAPFGCSDPNNHTIITTVRAGGAYNPNDDPGFTGFTLMERYTAVVENSSGNVGIGTTAPTQKLHLRNGDTNLVFNIDNSVADKVAIEAFNDGNTQKRDILLNPWGGNVGIGTTAPEYKLDVVGDIRVSGDIKVSGTAYLGITITSYSCSNASTCSVTCPTGLRVLGGGCYSSATSYSYALVRSYPNTDTSWYCQTAAATTLTAYAICARIGP